MSFLINALRDLLSVLLPKKCCGCGTFLEGDERNLCTHCLAHLPLTHYGAVTNNATELRLMGRIHFEAATSLMHFHKGNIAQGIVHAIKYYGEEDLGFRMGRLLGHDLAASHRFDDIDIVIPVPLHKKKERERGYNQSLLLCRGIADICKWPIATDVIIRHIYTESQTRKDRKGRIDNISNAFEVIKPDAIAGKHILLVDDVITTGSTIAECADRILEVEETRISIASLTIAGS